MLPPTDRVLDVLARAPGDQMPIREIARRVETIHGTGHYSSIHEAVQELTAEGYLETRKSGRSRLVGLDPSSFLLPGKLAAVTFHRLRGFIEDHPELQPTIEALVDTLWDHPRLGSLALAAPGPNARIGRLELLVLTWPDEPDPGNAGSRTEIARRLEEHASAHALRIDPLLLEVPTFVRRLRAPERDPVQGMLQGLAPLLGPQSLWRAVLQAFPLPARADGEPPDPLLGPRLSLESLTANAERYGYPELGSPSTARERWSLEPVILELLARGARGRAGAGVLLAKNEADPWMLTFLARSRKLEAEVLGLVLALQDLAPRPWLDEVGTALRIYTDSPAPTERGHLQATLETYDALG